MSELLSFESALKRLVAGAAQVATGSEAVATLAALGRVLATDVTSEVAVPSASAGQSAYCCRECRRTFVARHGSTNFYWCTRALGR